MPWLKKPIWPEGVNDSAVRVALRVIARTRKAPNAGVQ
jgi:hypothetical protein